MKNVSTGFGLCVAAAAALAYPFVSSLAPNANAVGIGPTAVSAVAAAATAQGDPPAPTVVWMGVQSVDGYTNQSRYHRLWSDGRMEIRQVTHQDGWEYVEGCGSYRTIGAKCFDSGWIEVSPPPGGNGFACRSDLNGDRSVDGVDLGIMLAAWGSPVCNPDPTYACIGFGGGIAP